VETLLSGLRPGDQKTSDDRTSDLAEGCLPPLEAPRSTSPPLRGDTQPSKSPARGELVTSLVAPALTCVGSKWNKCHEANYLLSSHHLHRPSNNMGLRDFLSLPKGHRRSRSKARSEIGSIEGQGEADLVAHQRPTESTPDLRIGASTSPTSSPLTSRDRESGGTRTPSPRIINLTTLHSRHADRSISDRLRSVFRRDQNNRPKSSDYIVDPSAAYEKKSSWKSTAYATTKLAIHMVKESSDVFPPLKSVAGGLSAILKHCDVHPPTFHITPLTMLTAVPANDEVSPNYRIISTPS